MLRTVWYLVKICLVLGVATYLATLPGAIRIEWEPYHVTLQMGFLAVSAFFLFLAMVFASGVAYRIMSFPRAYSRYRKQKRHAQGYKALLRSLTAAATGDYKNARYLAHRAQRLLPEDEGGLPLLLQAQALREMGRDTGDVAVNADEPFRLLLKNAETSLLGLQGLMQNAILASDFSKALVLAREAVQKYPKNYSLLRTVYDLEIRNRLWSDALLTLDKAVKYKIIEKDQASRDRVAIYCVLGDMALEGGRGDEALAFFRKGVDADASFIPALVRLGRLYKDRDQRRKALSLVAKAWKKHPHRELAGLWADLAPVRKIGDISPRYKWVESLVSSHPDALCSVLALAQAAIEDGLWGDARSMLVRAEKISASEDVYRLWVRLEEETARRPEVIRQWLDRVYQAPKAAGWICSKSRRPFAVWQAVVEPEGYFNTLIWQNSFAEKEVAVAALTAA